ncbi:MAG TPA: hypothetical protein DIW81_09480 [Planctomycetaceae bacterium]|nr:hypothetical protein [Planctomycetaceae bacterium]
MIFRRMSNQVSGEQSKIFSDWTRCDQFYSEKLQHFALRELKKFNPQRLMIPFIAIDEQSL